MSSDAIDTRPVGLTRDAGFQIGVQRTAPRDLEDTWRHLVGAGVETWLGAGARLEPEPGTPYVTADGTTGEVRSFRERDRVRLTWQPPGRESPTIVQVALTPRRSGTALRFHQERLADPEAVSYTHLTLPTNREV